MIYLTFSIKGMPFALPAERIHRIIPNVPTRHLPHAPEEVVGLLEYRKRSVPVLDLSVLMNYGPSPSRLSTRILLVNYVKEMSDDEKFRLLGLVAPSATATIDVIPNDLTDKGIALKDAAYLGQIATVDHQFVQTLDLDRLLSDSLKESLFAETT